MKQRVADIMTREVNTVYEEDNVARVLQLLKPFRFRHVPVIDDGKAVVGILSLTDLLQLTSQGLDQSSAALAREARVLEQTFVRDIMSQQVITIEPEAPLREAAQRMYESRVGALPVVDAQGALVGIISTSDLLRHLARPE